MADIPTLTAAEREKLYAVQAFLDVLGKRFHPRILVDVDGELQIVVDGHLITFKILSVEPVDA